MLEWEKTWHQFKIHVTVECHDYKDDTKKEKIVSFKSNKLLQTTTAQVLNQIKSDALKDEVTITNLRNQNSQSLLKVGKNNKDT